MRRNRGFERQNSVIILLELVDDVTPYNDGGGRYTGSGNSLNVLADFDFQQFVSTYHGGLQGTLSIMAHERLVTESFEEFA